MTREEIVQRALNQVNTDTKNNIALLWATGVGKSKGAILIQEKLEAKKVLLLVAEIAHKQNWEDEYIKWDKYSLFQDVTIECYASLKKYNDTEWDLIIMDEAHHSASDLRLSILEDIHAKHTILLSAASGYYPFNPRSTGTSRASSSNLIDQSTSIVSTDFENEIFGQINTKLKSIQDLSAFVFPFFVRYAVRLYDGSLVKHSQPFLMLPSKLIPFYVSIADTNKMEFNFPFASKLNYSFSAISGISNYTDIIQSVDIFISQPIYSYLQNAHINGMIDNPYYDPAKIYPQKILGGFFKKKEDIIDEIKGVGNFYHVLSIPIESFQSAQTSKTLVVKNPDSLVNQKPMDDDYLTHQTISAENSFIYNNKLHLSGVVSERFEGFKLGSQTCYYEGAKSQATINIGDQPFIFYPNPACKLLQLNSTTQVQGVTNYKNKFITLSEHKALNGSFYIDPDLNNIENDAEPSPIDIIPIIYGLSQPQKDIELNKLYVSAHQNPFIFPAVSRVTLPVGKIIAMASNTEAISQGQFGQFPLYVFTDDGVWALEVDREGKYMARQPVSRDVCINPNILQMDKHIGFITAKGLMILSGTQTECITDILRENNIRTSKLPISSFISAIQASPLGGGLEGANLLASIYNTDSIETFLSGCSLAYEYINGNGRIFVINGSYSYAYVFDIQSRSWSKVTVDYTGAVNNYPDCYVQNSEGKLSNLSTIPPQAPPSGGGLEGAILTMFVTRPISQADRLFSINRLIHRGIFASQAAGMLNTVIYGSRNGIDYTPVASSKHHLLTMRGSPFRYFKIAVIAALNPSDALSGAQLQLTHRYTNRLR